MARIALSLPPRPAVPRPRTAGLPAACTGVEVILRKPNAIRFADCSGCRLVRRPGDYAPFAVYILLGSAQALHHFLHSHEMVVVCIREKGRRSRL